MRRGHYLKLLLDTIGYYHLADRHPDEIDDIVLMAEHGMLTDSLASAYLLKIQPLVDAQKRCWNGLPRAPTQDEIGEFDVLLGELFERSGVRVGIRFLDKPRHILISGATGSAKSSLLRRLITAIDTIHVQIGKPISILVLDLKGDFVDIPERLGRKRWRHFSVHDGFRIGLNPPVGFRNPTSWLNQISRIIAAHCGLVFSASSLAAVVRFALPHLNNPPTEILDWPRLATVLEIMQRSPADVFATKRQYKDALEQRLEYLVENSGDLFDTTHGFDVIKDLVNTSSSQCAVIDMTTLSPLLVHIVVDIICSQILFLRMFERVTEAPLFCLVIDEADTLCSYRTAALYPEGFTPLGQTAKTGREFQIMLALAMTFLGDCSQLITSNATYHFIYNQSDPASTLEASRTLHLDRGQAFLGSLQPGACIYKESQGPCSHAMLMKTDYEEPSHLPRPETFDQLAYVPGKGLDDPEMQDLAEALDRHIAEHKQAKMRRGKREKADKDHLSEHAYKLIHAIPAHLWAPAQICWKATGDIPSPNVQKSVRKELADRGLAESDLIRLGSANVLLYWPTEDGWAFVKCKPPVRTGRGSIAHQHISHWISLVGRQEGLKTDCEYLLADSSHPVDCAWQVEEHLWDVHEVIVSATNNILQHLTTLSQSSYVRNIIIVCTQKKILERLQREILPKPVVMVLGDRLRWDLAETFLRRLWQ